jgi:2'-5' RNA ligase
MRLFFAGFPDDESRRRIAAALPAFGLEQKPSVYPSEKYHLTLVFIGAVSDGAVQALREIGESQRVERISLRFDRWEYWHGARAVVAATPDRPEPLMRLRAGLGAGLARRGIAFDDKPLRPHITVARKLAQAPVLPELSEINCTLRALSLVSSVTAPTGSIYTVVDTWPLLDTGARG